MWEAALDRGAEQACFEWHRQLHRRLRRQGSRRLVRRAKLQRAGKTWATCSRTMDQLMETDVADRTRPMILLGVFAGLALVLACIGVYGVLAYAVAERTREIGVRMALGAKPMDVTRMILRGGVKLSAIGLLAGGALAAGLANLLETLLFGVTAVAPGIYVGTAGMLLLVALMACVIPAQRASRVDPAVALRND
ncbi:MAG: hypothetical protein AUF67_14235 [Acidobacteria bacterium 13_1_20CM_58_21]|nr:MAG: hypothetical protein AUF67_14235 [Acidobacteria bacterium 13_1_20CM_58_21]